MSPIHGSVSDKFRKEEELKESVDVHDLRNIILKPGINILSNVVVRNSKSSSEAEREKQGNSEVLTSSLNSSEDSLMNCNTQKLDLILPSCSTQRMEISEIPRNIEIPEINDNDDVDVFEEELPEYIPETSSSEVSSDEEQTTKRKPIQVKTRKEYQKDMATFSSMPVDNLKDNSEIQFEATPKKIISNDMSLSRLRFEDGNGEIPDERNVTDMPILPIATIAKTNDNKRKWDKRFFCLFCKKMFTKLPRHLYTKHSEEPEVSRIMLLNKHSTERKKLIQQLQNCGSFIRNTTAIKEGQGVIVPKRRIQNNAKKDIRNYLPCTSCYQMFSVRYLSRHKSKCLFKSYNEFPKRNRSLRAQSYLMLPVGYNVSERFKECILSKMSGDEIYKTMKRDWLIMLYGEAEFRRLGYDTRYHRTIIDRCRELARLLLTASKQDPNITRLNQLFFPNKYKLLRDSVLELSGFDDVTGTFDTPSLALKLGFTIKKCANLIKGEYLEDEILRLRIPDLDTFLSLLESKWETEVSAHARRTLVERKWNTPKRMPLAKDIQILNKYLKERCLILQPLLEAEPNKKVFEELTEITLIMTIILNRRRVGEVQLINLKDYEKIRKGDPESDVFDSLNEIEKHLSQSLVRLVIKGKRGRGVPVLLTKTLKDNIDLLIKKRIYCGVDINNKYLFASIRHTCGFYRAHILLKKYAQLAGCQNVETITSTRLRKHVAIMVQLLNLKEHELDSLAKFMGHDIKVHREYYRLADETVELAKISKILLTMENGDISSLKGKNLDEIDINDFIYEEDENQENSAAVSENSQNILKISPNELTNVINQEHQAKIILNKEREDKINYVQAQDVNLTKSCSRKISTRKPWTPSEVKLTTEYFKNFLAAQSLPGKKIIEQFLELNSCLLNQRTWKNIKDFLHHRIKAAKKLKH